MTIYTTKNTEKKDDGGVPPPEVSDTVLLIDEKGQPLNDLVKSGVVAPVNLQKGKNEVQVRSRRFSTLHVCAALIILPLGLSLLTGCIWLYKHLNEGEIHYIGRCGVDFHQFGHMDPLLPQMKKFQQDVEISDKFEKIDMPSLGNARRSVTFHDFSMNVTAIIDKENGMCFLLPLNRTLVKPPKDFWDLLRKLSNGHFTMDAQLLQARYQVKLPQLTSMELKTYGPYVGQECEHMDAYRMEEEDKRHGISKRSVCPFQGLRYCEGATGTGELLCLTITRCA